MERAVNADFGRASDLLGATGDLFLTQGRSTEHVRLAQRFRDRAVATAEPEMEALGHGGFGNAAVRSASALAGEQRRARLEEAVAAYREALVFRTAERAPMDYAATQNNLGAALRELAGGLAGEQRRARLEEAAAAFRQALVFRTAERAPMHYAATQNNLGNAL